ncbi:MAG: hypothetical protein NTX07_05160, partial [Solirubrobacterales bacterium]|nr:hypothetical protein [Solirubrobacterales bacterium]
VGWVPGIRRMTEIARPMRLALSLHAPNDKLRSRIMPVNDKYPIEEVMDACDEHARTLRRRVFIEYVMLKGVNDSPETAVELAELLDSKHYKVNLIRQGHDRNICRDSQRTRPYRDGSSHTGARHRGGLRTARRTAKPA